MALTYDDSAQLMNDSAFRGRVKVACLNFASYIIGEPNTTPAHNSRLKWAQSAWQSPDMTSQNVTPPTVMEPQVQADGKNVTDPDLQTAVETVVNSML